MHRMRTMRNESIFGAVLAGSILTQAASLGATVTRPTLTISYPTANLSVTNPTISLSGKTKDKAAVTNVWYQLNGGGWKTAATSNAWTSWAAEVTLMAGTNMVQAYAEDSTGTPSLTNAVRFTYAPMVPLVVNVSGPGTVTPNYNRKLLKFGSRYSITAKADGGCKFLGWSGNHTSSTPSLSFVMGSNLTFTASFKDVTPPVLMVFSPKVHQKVTNAVFTVTGKASDNVGVTSVLYQLNGTGWNPATTTNVWTNWTAQVTLSLGTNIVQAYALDAAGNASKTNTVNFVSTASGPAALVLSILSPTAGQTVTAAAFTVSGEASGGAGVTNVWYQLNGAGWIPAVTANAWSNWTAAVTLSPGANVVEAFAQDKAGAVSKTNSVSFTYNNSGPAALVLTILSPTAGQVVTTAAFTVSGEASGGAGVTNVWYQLNGAGWTPAVTANAWSNWTAAVTLTPGANVVEAFAEDKAGAVSKTNSVSFTYNNSGPGDVAPASLSGMSVLVTSTNDTAGSTTTFGDSTYSQSTLPSTNQSNTVGNYTYVKQSSGYTALLTLEATEPPDLKGTNVVALTFSSSTNATYISTNGDGSISTGTVVLSAAPDLAPASLTATLDALDSGGTSSTYAFASGTLNYTQQPGIAASATYTYNQYSPVGGLVVIDFTSPAPYAGTDLYLIVTWSSATAGSYAVETFPPGSTTSSFDRGTFTIP